MGISRRDFLKFSGLAALGGAGAVSASTDVEAMEFKNKLKGCKVTTSICPYCAVGCGLKVYSKNGKVVHVEGDPDHPINEGSCRPLKVLTRPGSLLNAQPPSPVAAGNVETSQRIVDVLLGALALAIPERIPAASCGSMNNITVGGKDRRTGNAYAYYETIGGGMGGRPISMGLSGIHNHT